MAHAIKVGIIGDYNPDLRFHAGKKSARESSMSQVLTLMERCELWNHSTIPFAWQCFFFRRFPQGRIDLTLSSTLSWGQVSLSGTGEKVGHEPTLTKGGFLKMIARVWRGIALADKVDGYVEHFRQSVLPELHRIDGFRGAYVLCRSREDGVALTVQTIWRSMEAIRKFAGENVGTAVVAPEAAAFFLEFDSFVTHHEVLLHEQT